MRILVLGLGNDLYGDDGIGPRIVRLLKAAWALETHPARYAAAVEFVECSASGAALLDIIHGYDALVIVDTILKDRPVTGRIDLLDGREIRTPPGPSPHYISIPQTLALGRACGLRMPVAIKVIGIESANAFALGQGLSPEMVAQIPKILDAAQDVIRMIAAAWPFSEVRP